MGYRASSKLEVQIQFLIITLSSFRFVPGGKKKKQKQKNNKQKKTLKATQSYFKGIIVALTPSKITEKSFPITGTVKAESDKKSSDMQYASEKLLFCTGP